MDDTRTCKRLVDIRMSDLTLKDLFGMSKATAGVCCFCGSPDENFVTVNNGLLVTTTIGTREQFFAAHRLCMLGTLHDVARTGPIADSENPNT